MDLIEPLLDSAKRLSALGYEQGLGDFTAKFDERSVWNIPGPLYVGDDDSCGTGQGAAPNCVWLPHGPDDAYITCNSGEFIFRQPASEFELRQVVRAAEINTMSAYAFDGDAHWTAALVEGWWRDMTSMVEKVAHAVAQHGNAVHDAAQRQLSGDRTAAYPEGPWPSAELRRWLDYMQNGAEAYLERYAATLDRGPAT